MSPPPVLPPPLARALARVGTTLHEQRDVARDFVGIVEGLSALPTATLAQAAKEIVEATRLYHGGWATPSDQARLFRVRLDGRTQLARVQGLEFLFLFHRDGFLREAALHKIAGGLPSAFLFAAVAARLNDWVAQVRMAAVECAAETFPATDADVIAEAGLVLLPRENTWLRWTEERTALAAAYGRTDVADRLAEAVVLRPNGPMAAVLRLALRSDNLDRHLERIAREAVQPAVRALAARTLIDGFAIWPEGWEQRWIDRSMGLWRQEQTLRRRPIAEVPPRDATIRTAACDRSVEVRKVALDCLLRGDFTGPLARELAGLMAFDRSAAVRERADFILRQPSGPMA